MSRAVVLAIFFLLAPTLASAGDPAAALERGAYLERAKGDLAGAEAAYREALAGLREDDPARAEALFRLGSMLVRAGRVEEGRGRLVELGHAFPGRRDLVARAELLVAMAGPPAAAPDGERPRGRVLAARREAGLFAFEPGRRGGVEIGRRVAVYREGKLVGEALVVRALDAVAVAKLVSGEAALGDALDVPRPAEAAAAVESQAALAEAARRLVERIAVEEGAAAPAGGVGAAANVTATAAIAVEVRVVGCDAAFLEALPFAFERLAPARVEEREGPLGGEAGPVAVLSPAALRTLLDRLGRPETGWCATIRTETLALESAKRAEIGLRPAGDGQLAIGLRALPGAAGALELEIDAVALERPPEAGKVPLAPRLARVRGRVGLDRVRPAALVGGLRDPFAAPGGRGGARLVLILFTVKAS